MHDSFFSIAIAAIGSVLSVKAAWPQRPRRRGAASSKHAQRLKATTRSLRLAVDEQQHVLDDASRHLPWIRSRVERAQRRIEDTLQSIERLTDADRFERLFEAMEAPPVLSSLGAPPDTAARVFLSAGTTFDADDQGSYTLLVTGPIGSHTIVLTSGMTTYSVAREFRIHEELTGVSAVVDSMDSSLVKLVSAGRGTRNFVIAKRLAGGPKNALLDRNRENHADRQVGYGRPRPGDPD